VADAKWLEISLVVDGELAEAVAEVLDRFTSGGVVVESNVRYNDAEDEGTPYGPVKVYGYIINDAAVEENRRRVEEALWHLHSIRELPQPSYRPIADENWMAAWKDHYHPIPIGRKLLILPAWLSNPDPARLAVKIDPSMAFGTGTHPSTQLCLGLVEDYVHTGDEVIDVAITAPRLPSRWWTMRCWMETSPTWPCTTFNEQATPQLRAALDELLAQNPKG